MRYENREDMVTAGKINVALVYCEMLGRIEAAEYLKGQGIPAVAIERILIRGRHRGAQRTLYSGEICYSCKITCRRRNSVQAAIVEAALKIDNTLGRVFAQRILTHENIPVVEITRLLADGPRQVRASAKRRLEDLGL